MSTARSVWEVLRGVRRRARSAWAALTDPFVRHSYAQEGEDLILDRIFGDRPPGFYVDVGAHHPRRFSSTHFFYLKHWSGVNIDATPGSMEAFRRARPRDRNIEAAIALERGPIVLHVYDEPALNSRLDAEQRDVDTSRYNVLRRVTVTARPLADVLAETVPAGQAIDFLNVDVEGMDLEVLRSNDWGRFRPAYVLAEELRGRDGGPGDGRLVQYMTTQGYELYCRTMNTLFFRDASSSRSRDAG